MRPFAKQLSQPQELLGSGVQLNQRLLPVSGLCIALLLLGGCAGSSTPDAASSPSAAVSSAESTSAAPGGKIDINSAPIAELDKLELPGTKASLSERIQGGRPYASTDDLVSKKVVSEDEYKLIKTLIVAGQVK